VIIIQPNPPEKNKKKNKTNKKKETFFFLSGTQACNIGVGPLNHPLRSVKGKVEETSNTQLDIMLRWPAHSKLWKTI
jgi:hypothetical protein